MEITRKQPKKQNRRLVIILVAADCLAAAVLIFLAVRIVIGRNYGFRTSGNIGENAAAFGMRAPSSGLASDYLKNTGYKIISCDKKKQTITMSVSVPDLSGIGDIVKESAAKASGTDYEKRLAEVKKEVASRLSSLPRVTAEVTLPVEKKNDRYVIRPTEELQKAIYGQLETLTKQYYAESVGGMTNETP
jgi:hypothetical protein